MLLLPCLSSGAGATASTRPAVVHAARKPFTHRRLWNSSSKHRRGSVLVACSSGAIFSVNLMKQQCSISRRTEVELQSGCTGRYPFRVATFNILADGLAQSGDFVKVPISCLMWEHRLPLILQEIRAADADIICLQELNHFDTLATTLVPEGYSCFFRAKKSSPALKFGFPADGIALFYRHSRFSCSPAPAGHCFDSVDGQPAPQGFVTAQLHDKLAGRTIIVAATHLKAKAGSENEQTRVHQACQLLQELQNMHDRFHQLQLQQQPQVSSHSTSNSICIGGDAPQQAAVLVCGDFNTTPDSDTVKVIRQHQLGLGSIWDIPWACSAPNNGGKGSNGNGRGFDAAVSNYQPISKLSQGSRSTPGSNGNGHGSHNIVQQQERLQQHSQLQPEQAAEFTTWKFRTSGVAKRTIDYIWFSKQHLAPISRWKMFGEADIGPQGLPNMNYPSDHMCVTCQFAWTN